MVCLRIALAALGVSLAAGCAGHAPGVAPPLASHASRHTGPGRALRIVPRLGHTEAPNALAVSADARFLATADSSVVKIWDVATGALLRNFAVKDGLAMTVALSSDGGRVAVHTDEHVTVSDTATGARVGDFPAAFSPVLATPDGRSFVYSPHEGGLVMRDFATLEVRVTFGVESPAVLAFDGSGKRLVSASRGEAPQLWDAGTGALVRRFAQTRKDYWDIGFAASGRVVSTSGDKALTVWNTSTGAVEREIPTRGPALSLAVSPDGHYAVTHNDANNPMGPAGTCDVEDKEGKPACDSRSTTVWDLDRMVPLRQIELFHVHATFFPSGTRVVSSVSTTYQMQSGETNLRIWDILGLPENAGDTPPTLLSLDPGTRPVHDVAFSPDGKSLVHAGVASVWDLTTLARTRTQVDADGADRIALADDGRLTWSLYGGAKDVGHLVEDDLPGAPKAPEIDRDCSGGVDRDEALAPAARRAFVASFGDGTGGVRVCDFATGTARLVDKDLDVRTIAISADGHVGARAHGGVALYDLDHATKLRDLQATGTDKGEVDYLALSHDGSRVVGTHDKALFVWDGATGELARSIAREVNLYSLAISADGRRAATSGVDGAVELLDLDSGALVRTLVGHAGVVAGLDFSPDGRYLASSSEDGTTRLWRLDTGDSIALAVSDTEWIVYSDDGYFDASRDGGSLVSVVDGLRPFHIEQLALTHNRPDLLLSRMGMGSDALVAHFRARYQRRLLKVGMREDDASTVFDGAPDARIIAAKVTGKTVELTLALTAAPGGALRRYGVFVDDVPILGALGKETSGAQQTIALTVELISGRNKIEVSVFDDAGVESLRDVRYVDGPREAKGDLYYLGFGVSRYRDARLNLGYAHKDALDLGAAFAAMKGDVFAAVHTKVIVNEEATKGAIAAAKDYFRAAKADDTIVLFIAGHGVHTRDAAADYYYATSDVNVHDLRGTAAPFELIEGLLDGVAPRRKLFLMDTCQSGEMDDDDAEVGAPTAGSRGMVSRGIRGLVLDDGATTKLPPLSSGARSLLLNRDRYVYNDLTRRTGAIVFSSSRGVESSYEGPEWNNGAFTAELLAGLQTGEQGSTIVTVDALREYVAKAVPERTNGRQHPTVDRDNREMKFGFPLRR